MNFCHCTHGYDEFSNLPTWAKETLKGHEKVGREPVYTREQLDNAETHDEYWNAAMNEMRYTGATCTTT
jgi:deoxyribodipyrimidine photo-lyase